MIFTGLEFASASNAHEETNSNQVDKTNEVRNNLEDKNEISEDMIEIKTEQIVESIQQDPLQILTPTKEDPIQILTNIMGHHISIKEDPIQIGTNTMGRPNILPLNETKNLSENMNKSHPTKKDPLPILTDTMEHPINEDPIQIRTNTVDHPNILPINESENLSENMNKSQRKKIRSPKFLNESYTPAIKFYAFDPHPPEMRGNSNAQKKNIDEMVEKNSKKKPKQKFCSICKKVSTIENCINEHYKLARKKSRRKLKFGSISGNGD